MTELADPGILLKVISFILVLGVLVFVHEFGHYIVGRLFRTRVDVFSIGFGRELFGWNDKAGTRWKVCALPLGGYVKFHGDANAASMPADTSAASQAERAGMLACKPLWQRALIVFAGPGINFLFAILIFAGLFMTIGQAFTPARVTAVLPDSPAALAGVQTGDLVTRVDGQSVTRFEELARKITINPGTPVQLTVQRDGQDVTLFVTPDVVEQTDRFGNVYSVGRLGVMGDEQQVVQRGLFSALYHGTTQTFALTGTMLTGLGQIITGQRSVKEMGGPLKIAEYSGQSASLGLIALITFVALISINLGLVNLFPIPMLDGGHLFLYAIEAVFRRPLPPRVQEWAFMAGFAVVVSFMLFVTANDLASYGVWDKLAGLFS